MAELIYTPIQAALVDERGYLTDVWRIYFDALFKQVGGLNALTNTQLSTLSSSTVPPIFWSDDGGGDDGGGPPGQAGPAGVAGAVGPAVYLEAPEADEPLFHLGAQGPQGATGLTGSQGPAGSAAYFTADDQSEDASNAASSHMDYNAQRLQGYTWSSPPAFGNGLPNTGTFTTVTSQGDVTASATDGNFNGGTTAGRAFLKNNGSTTYIGLYGQTHATLPHTFSLVVNSTAAARIDSDLHVQAGNDNVQTLGTAAKRWSTVYAGTGAINTSDAREKTEVSMFTAAEINAAKQLSKEIGTYKFLAAIAAKGEAARIHIGMTVQRAVEIMQANGLDPFGYGFICHDAWGDAFLHHPAIEAQEATDVAPAILAEPAWVEQTQVAGDRYAFRYDQLTLFIAAGIEARLAAMEQQQ